jgi:hypothetical protein
MNRIIEGSGRTSIGAIFVVAVVAMATGCQTFSSKAVDPASGYWAGQWYAGDTPGGDLTCTVTPAGEGLWDASFFATFGVGASGTYEVKIPGKLEDGKVVFGGQTDQGENSGGLYTYEGTIENDVFSGRYTYGRSAGGRFEMMRAAPPPPNE